MIKPIGAFIEYTLKPLIDDSRELLDCLDEKGFKKEDIYWAFWMFLARELIDFAKALLVTGMICLTVSRYLNTIP